MDIGEVARIADIAERYHPPGLKTKTLEYAKDYRFPHEKLLQTFSDRSLERPMVGCSMQKQS